VVDVAEASRFDRRRAGCLATALAVAGIAALLGLLAFGTGSAQAIEIFNFEAYPSTTQAGSHPDLTIKFRIEHHTEGETVVNPSNCICNDALDADVELPTGLIGNPHSTPQCKSADFARDACPTDSQIGIAQPTVDFGGFELGPLTTPLYNLVPKPTQGGLFGWKVPLFDTPVYTVLGARTGSDYGLNAFTDGIEQSFPLAEYSTVLWGVPADSSHDEERAYPGGPSNSPREPFLQNPETCNTQLRSTLKIVGYDRSVNYAEAPWPQTTGCDQLAFNPALSAQPTTTESDAPSGLEVDLKVPQNFSPEAPSPSELRAATVVLPKGVSLNPNAADGKSSCTDQEARFGTEDEAQCPEYSKIGTVVIDSSALPAPIPGAAYIGKPLPGERYRVFLTADGYATHVKLAGVVEPDPETGQLTVAFDNLPQSPLTEFQLHFFGSERGILATPTQCGTYPVQSTFVPWDEALSSQSAVQFFTIDSGPGGSPCPGATRPFDPGFGASSLSNTAGLKTPFHVSVTRSDGDQYLRSTTVTPPPGLLASLAGIPYCSEAALAAASTAGYPGLTELSTPVCPADSEIGVSDAGAGAGSHPIHLAGKVYLAGPYKGAPLSLAVITPAVSGPYDLGNVVVRVALNVDPTSAQVTAVTDPLPLIFESIPVRLRSLIVWLNRPGFTINPTNCSPFAVNGDIEGDEGTHAERSASFQVASCAGLGYHPNLHLRLTGGVNRRGHPAIHAVFKAKPGEANSRRVAVTLPKGEELDNSHVNSVCSRKEFAADACPAGSVLGSAEARTPLLDGPLQGLVYLRSSSHRLPDMVVTLHGQVDLELSARIDTVHGRLRTTFEGIPDAPISAFDLRLRGGSRGLLINTKNLCGAHKKALMRMAGQNNRRGKIAVSLNPACGKARHKRHRLHSRVGADR
jgi:hypothetical protein